MHHCDSDPTDYHYHHHPEQAVGNTFLVHKDELLSQVAHAVFDVSTSSLVWNIDIRCPSCTRLRPCIFGGTIALVLTGTLQQRITKRADGSLVHDKATTVAVKGQQFGAFAVDGPTVLGASVTPTSTPTPTIRGSGNMLSKSLWGRLIIWRLLHVVYIEIVPKALISRAVVVTVAGKLMMKRVGRKSGGGGRVLLSLFTQQYLLSASNLLAQFPSCECAFITSSLSTSCSPATQGKKPLGTGRGSLPVVGGLRGGAGARGRGSLRD